MAEIAEKSKKPIWKKWWFWVLVVVFLAALGNALGGGEGSTSTTTTTSVQSPAASPAEPAEAPVEDPVEAPAPAAPEAPAKTVARIGEPVPVGDLVFTVSGASPTNTLSSVFGNKQGSWITIPVTVQNNGKEAVTIDSSFFRLLESDGTEYETDSDSLMYIDTDENFFLQKINPKMSASGTLLFAVPEGLNPADLHLRVQTGFFGTQSDEISLAQ